MTEQLAAVPTDGAPWWALAALVFALGAVLHAGAALVVRQVAARHDPPVTPSWVGLLALWLGTVAVATGAGVLLGAELSGLPWVGGVCAGAGALSPWAVTPLRAGWAAVVGRLGGGRG